MTSEIREHQNKCNDNEKLEKVVRTTQRWHGDLKVSKRGEGNALAASLGVGRSRTAVCENRGVCQAQSAEVCLELEHKLEHQMM